MVGTTAVVVQSFVKLDTLRAVLQSLARCDGAEKVDLILWHEGLEGSRRQGEFERPWHEVRSFLSACPQSQKDKFRSVEIFSNEKNLGPYITCKKAIDYGFQEHDFVVFLEDDVIVSRDALIWFQEVYHKGLLDQEQIWAIAAESIFFDAREKSVDAAFIQQAIAAAVKQNLVNKYIAARFVPSSCFATSRRRWGEFADTRGQTNGDVVLCERCNKENRGCVFPVVARGKDVGMLHDLGYSVTIHSKAGVLPHAKHTYLLAEDLLPAGPVGSLRLEPFTDDQGWLFRQSTGLEGFAQRLVLDPTGTRPTETVDELAEPARAAFSRRDLPEALRRWEVVQWQFPGEPAGYLGRGETLRDLGRLDEAETLFGDAMERFPHNEWLAARHAEIAMLRKNWSAALERWIAVCDRFPDRAVGHIGRGETLREMGRLDEADETLAAAVWKFPENEWAAQHYAMTAARRGDWPEALRRWRSITSRFPDHADGYVGLAAALREAGELEEADAILGPAVTRFANNQWIAIGYAQTAMQRGDWEEACRRWGLVVERFPHEPTGYVQRAAALIEAGHFVDAEITLNTAAQNFPTNQSVARGLLSLTVRRTGAARLSENLEKLSSEMEMYSQFGEDGILQSYFRNKWWKKTGTMNELPPTGFYVDIGAHHPYFISNTWSFYKKGWSGINVEPTPGAITDFNDFRARDINLAIGVASKDGNEILFSYGRNVMNTMNKESVDLEQKPQEILVETMRLETIFDKYVPDHTTIDFLTIDVEGFDLEVLRSNDWARYRPEIVVVEYHETAIDKVINSSIYQSLIQWGYELYGWAQPSLIFRRRENVAAPDAS